MLDPLDTATDGFIEDLQSCIGLRSHAAESNDAAFRQLAYEGIAVRLFRTHEAFIEQCFVAQMIGGPTDDDACDFHVKAIDATHAKRLLGEPPNGYLDWADPSRVRDRAKNFLNIDSRMHDVIGIHQEPLTTFRTIRNHIAHRSTPSLAAYRKAVRSILASEPEPLPEPGALLSLCPPTGRFKDREVLAALIDVVVATSAAVSSEEISARIQQIVTAAPAT